MRILLCGQKRFGRDALQLCQRLGHEIVAAYCPVDSADKLRIYCENTRLPARPAGTLRADAVPPGTDLISPAHSHDFISRPARLAARLGAIGYHPSLLPLHRGRDAVRWAVRLRERVTGGSIYWLNDTVDGGPVAARAPIFIRPTDGCLYGFDAKPGKQHWKADLNAIGGTKELFFECTPLVVNNVVIASLRHCIEAGPQAGAPLIAIKSGKPGEPAQTAWVIGKDRGGFSAQAVVQGGIVYVTSAPVEREGTYLLHAIDPVSGKENWNLVAGKTSDSMGIGSDGRLLYLANEDNQLIVVKPGATPQMLRSLEFSGRGISPRSSRAVTSDYGLCLPLEEGVLMVRMP